STSAMMQQASYQNWNFSTLWQISEGTAYPGFLDISIYEDPQPVVLTELLGSGTPEEPYLIMTASELNAIRQNLGAHYRIHNDLNLAATLVWNGGRGWQPVGRPDEPFTGTLDGNGMAIENLNIAAPLTNNVGFFGKITGGSISNLNLTALNLVAEDNAGAVAGTGASCQISNVSVQCHITGNNGIGGLLGVASGATIQNCSSSVNILGRNNYIGGLLGTANTNTLVSQSSSTGFVKGNSLVGGLLGELYNGNVSDCYSHANVTASTNLGGAAGRIGWGESGHLARCYSTGAITVNPGGYSAGGLVGSLYNGTISASYWDINSSGMSSSSGAGATGLSTTQITYPGSLDYFDTWDFMNVWRHDSGEQNSGYPLLAWQELPVPEAVQNLTISLVGEQILLQWQEVTGAAYYNIYSSADPYAPWDQWTYIGQSNVTNFQSSGGERRFFMVKTVGGRYAKAAILPSLFLADSSPSLAGLFPNTLLGKSRPRVGEESATH
ncbi:MAG TPA: GLUG motif-containing protein, partial [Candidatus Cloacimonadota bacterium]|nr:GLUG motif-containing protein [Candidatus Cloacimonadota bacterium]